MVQFFRILFALVLTAQGAVGKTKVFPLETPEGERTAIRLNPTQNETFLVPPDQRGRNSVGIPIGTNNPQEFQKQLKASIQHYGQQALLGSTFFVMGIEMKNEKQVQKAFEEAIEEAGAKDLGLKVVVYSVPTAMIKKRLTSVWTDFFESLKYFQFSPKRDYQAPYLVEAIVATTIVGLTNISNIFFILPQRMDGIDYALTAFTHLALGLSTNIFFKTLGNWVTRYQSEAKRIQWIERNIKQIAITSLFVLNYNIFGNITEISNVMLSDLNGLEKVLITKDAIATLAREQLLTILLNAIYYTTYNANGFSRWVNSVKGAQRSALAQKMLPWIRVPTSALQTALLVNASTSTDAPVLDLGIIEVGTGHLYFAGAIAFGSFVFGKWPNFLDSLLTVGFKVQEFKHYLKGSTKGQKHRSHTKVHHYKSKCFELAGGT